MFVIQVLRLGKVLTLEKGIGLVVEGYTNSVICPQPFLLNKDS